MKADSKNSFKRLSGTALRKLIILHRYWLMADSIRVCLFMKVPVSKRLIKKRKLSKEEILMGNLHSSLLRLHVFYAVLYTVLEGYIELKYKNPAIDALIADEKMLYAFHGFRNKTLHFEPRIIPKKQLIFLEKTGSEVWARKVHEALKVFLEDQLSPYYEGVRSGVK